MIARAQRPSTLDPIHNHFRVPRQLAWLVVAFAAATGACDKVPLFAPTGSAITLSADKLVAPLNSDVKITAVVQESAGTPTQNGTTVNFSSNLGTFEPAEAQTHGGRVTVTFHTGSTSGVATIAATSGAAKAATDANALKITIGAAAVKTIQMTATSTTVRPGGGSVEIIASVLDEAGNKVPSVPVVFSTTAGSLSASTAVTDASGDARTTLTTNREATVTASAGSVSNTTGVKITVGAAPKGTVAASPTSINAGQNTTITVTPDSANTSSTSVVVDFGDGTTQSLGTVTGAKSVTHTYSTPGTYAVTATFTDANGDTGTAAASVTVGQRLVNAVSISTDATQTFGTPTRFTATVTSTTGAPATSNVRVDFGDGTAVDLGAVSGATTVAHTYATAGTYQARATLTDTAGSSSTATTFVTIPITVTASPSSAAINSDVRLTVNGLTSGTFDWDFGDGGIDTTSSNTKTHSYSKVGTYTVRVTATASDGTKSTASTTVTITS